VTDDRQLYLKAVAEVLEFRKPSASFLQRRLGIGYSEAAALVEKMEAEKVVGPPDITGRREVLVDKDGGRKDAPQAAQAAAGSPWARNEGEYDQPSSAPLKAPPPKHAAPSPPLYDEEAERKALRGVRALPRALPVPVVAEPVFEAWPAALDLDDEGRVVARDLAYTPEPKARDPDAISADRLRQIVERIEALTEQRSEITSIINDVRAFAKAIGFEPKAISAVIKMRAMEPSARMEFEAIVTTYRHALGIEEPAFAIRLPPAAAPLPPAPRRLSAREKRVREAILLTAASRAVEMEG
jgi:uncharacterized protein (UPF0335 family)